MESIKNIFLWCSHLTEVCEICRNMTFQIEELKECICCGKKMCCNSCHNDWKIISICKSCDSQKMNIN